MKPIKDLIPTLSPRAIYKSPLTGEAIMPHHAYKKLCDKVLLLTLVILEFYTKQPGSPSILVKRSEKLNSTFIHRSQRFVLIKRQLKNTDILLEAVCSLSIEHVISIEPVIGRLRISVH